MTRAEAWLTHVAALSVGGTGLVYGWMRYFAQPADPFAVVNHPWQPAMQHLHILSAPLLVFAAGLLWRDHVWRRVRNGFPRRRRTGLVLFALLAPMIASGYLLQVADDERWYDVWVAVHVVSSSAWVLGYVVHQLAPRSAASSPSVRP